MNKLLLSAAALALTATSAMAFTNAAARPVQAFTNLECIPVTLVPNDHDSNPVYKIAVNLELVEGSTTPKEFNVVHTRRNGITVDRSDQYDNASVWQRQGHTEWFWRGSLSRNPQLSMTGRVYPTSAGQWFYEESLSKNGRQDFFMNSQCHT